VPATEFVVRLLRELPEEQKRRLRELRVVREALEHDGKSRLEVDGVVNYTISGSYLAAYSVPLLRLGWGAAEVPGLLELTTPEFALVVRIHAVLALTAMGEEAVSAVPALMKLLDADDVLLRYSAANALVVIQLDEAPLNEILSRARLPNEDQVELCEWHCELCSEEQRERASFKGLDADTIQYYINALKYGRGSVRREVLRQIKLAGPNAAAALPEIDAALNDPNEMTRRLAHEAIDAIQPAVKPDGDQRRPD
jgi:HEAT repeat protein